MTSDDYKKRSEFAQAAMAAILSNPNPDVVRSNNASSYGNAFQFNLQAIARKAYDIADAMLAIEHKSSESK